MAKDTITAFKELPEEMQAAIYTITANRFLEKNGVRDSFVSIEPSRNFCFDLEPDASTLRTSAWIVTIETEDVTDRTGYLDVESAIQAARTHIQSYFDSDFSFEDEIQKNWTAEQLSEPNSELLSLSSMSKTQESLL